MLHIQDFHRRFNDSDVCLQYLFDLHYHDVECMKCNRKNAFHKHPTKLCYTCNCGQSHIFPKTGTIFEGSAIPLKKWFFAVFLMCQHQNGVSAKELERELGVTYPTAWRMRKNINAVINVLTSPERPYSSEALFLSCLGYVTEPQEKRSKKIGVLVRTAR